MREVVQWRTYDGVPVTQRQSFAVHAWIRLTFANEGSTKSATTLAFIDTGKSSASLAPRLISQLGLQQNGDVALHTNTETKTVATFRTVVSLPTAPHARVSMDCVELENPFPFSEAEAIIGMGFLQFGALVMQPIGKESFFHLAPDGTSTIRI